MTPALPLLALVGPTAVGKTALSLQLAQHYNGEIVSADSRLFYRGMDIGTAKPSAAEMAVIPHHLINICTPDQTLTLGQYQQMAYATIDAIHARGRLPILVGGTGQYVWAVLEGWGIPRVSPQPRLRQALATLGGPELARWLAQLDPAAAERLDPRNVRRVIRALEVTLTKGIPISEQQRKKSPPYNSHIIGLTRNREALYARVDSRVDQMIIDGLIKEVEQLLDAGYKWSLPAFSGLGYRQLRPFFAGETSLAEAMERIKFETHRFVRQQKSWFQPHDERITWFDLGRENAIAEVMDNIAAWLT